MKSRAFTKQTQYLYLSWSQVGTAIFSFVLAAHTFSQLVLRCRWSNLTCHIVFFVSWGLLLLNSCIGYFIVANPQRGTYRGIAGYWCGITPAYRTEGYASEYLFMLVSAALSFILCSLIILRLRGDFTVSDGYKVHFRHGAEFNFGSTRAQMVTEDLTMGAKQMLPHPIAYTVLVLPICIIAFRTSPDTPVSFLATISTAAVFVLSGFVNVVLFCTMCMALPRSWRQKSKIDTMLYSLSGSAKLSDMRRRRLTKTGRRSAKPGSSTLSIIVEKNVAIKYDEAEPTASSPSLSRITSPLESFDAHNGIQRDDGYDYHFLQISFPPPLRIRLDRDDLDKGPSAGGHLASPIPWNSPGHPVHPYRGHESSIHGPTPDFEDLSPVSPLAMALLPVTRNSSSPSVSTSKTAADQTRVFWSGLGNW